MRMLEDEDDGWMNATRRYCHARGLVRARMDADPWIVVTGT